MPSLLQKHPMLLLRDIERRCKQHAIGLPLRTEVKKTWTGVAFRVASAQLVARLTEVREVLTYPSLSPVPRAKAWVNGIANVRGNLLPIINLHIYLGKQSAPVGRNSRVLVINEAEIFAGLVVDEVLGIKRFVEEEYSTEIGTADSMVGPYLEGSYLQAGQRWSLFSIARLAGNPAFLQVAS
jgi:twitching motility protein PilI